MNREGIADNARRIAELEAQVTELGALVQTLAGGEQARGRKGQGAKTSPAHHENRELRPPAR